MIFADDLIQRLNAPTPSILARVRAKQLHRTARASFDRQRRIRDADLEAEFPGITATSAVIRSMEYRPPEYGNVSPQELISLATLCAYLRPSTVFEFGTFDGKTTLHLALNTDDDAHVTTIDLDPSDPLRQQDTPDTDYTRGVTVGGCFQGAAEAGKITQIFGNSMSFDHTPFLGTVDFIFVDAGHNYEAVKSDTAKALQMVRPGGIILWHDYFYGFPGVYRCLNDLSAQIRVAQVPFTNLVFHRPV